MTKTLTNGSTNFHADRKIYVAPVIDESYMNDAGDIIHILKNGNEISDNNYVKHWGSPAKGKINWKTKGEAIQHPQQKI